MDIDPSLSDAILRIRDSLDRFAILKNWSREDYFLAMDANLVWLYFQVDIFAKEYDSSVPDENDRYDEVYDHLEQDLKEDPGLYEATSILLWPFVLVHGKHPLGENYIRIDNSLLNPGRVPPRPMSQVTLRDEG